MSVDVEASSPQVPVPVTSLRRGVVWSFAGAGIYLACQYLTLMALARLTNKVAVGEFSLAMAIWTPVIVFSQMQLRQLQVTDVSGRYRFGEYFAFRVIATLVAMLVVIGVALFSNYSREMLGLIVIVGIAKSIESLSDLAYGRIQRYERRDLVALSMALRSLGSVVLFTGLLLLTGSLRWVVAGMAVAWGLAVVAYDYPTLARVARGESLWEMRSGRFLVSLLWFCLPLGAATALQTFSANLPRYFIEAYHGKSMLALFAVAVAPPALLTMLSAAVCETTLSRAAVYYQQGRLDAFARLALKTMLLPTAMGIAVTLLLARYGESILTVLFTAEYRAAAPVMVITAAGITVGNLAIVGNTIIAVGQMYRLQLLGIVLAVALQVPVCLLLVPRWGAVGAAWSDFVKYVFCMLFVTAVGMVAYYRRARALAAQSA